MSGMRCANARNHSIGARRRGIILDRSIKWEASKGPPSPLTLLDIGYLEDDIMGLTSSERTALIRRYAEGPARLKAALATVPSAALKWRPEPTEWSAHEIVCHCADSETNAYARIRLLVAERTEPTIVGYDQDVWALALDYHAHPLEPALALVEAG